MKKNHKKIDNQLIHILNNICDMAQKEIPGFLWLTHVIHYDFPKNGWDVIFIFDAKPELQLALQKKWNEKFLKIIQENTTRLDPFFSKALLRVQFLLESEFKQQ